MGDFASEVDWHVSNGFISRRKHPVHDLFILNYTPKTQYERFWNETTSACRGLVVDPGSRVRARCFGKFFNYAEVRDEVGRRLSSGLGFEVREKMDGSLGILYWAGGEPHIATRGSFESDQAVRATSMLRNKYPGFRPDPSLTYLFEIIYPENRICVDYGDSEELVFLACFENESGLEAPPGDMPFRSSGSFAADDFESLARLNLPNSEGFVVRFEDGFRFKIKFEDYVRLHSLIFSLSSKSVWESLRSGSAIPIDGIPDELHDWIRRKEAGLKFEYASLENEAKSVFSSIRDMQRGDFARAALPHRFSSVLFKMLDGRSYKDIIWKMIEPEYERPMHEEV
jgi:RNA ligase